MRCWRVLYKPDNTAFMVYADSEEEALDKAIKRNLKELDITKDEEGEDLKDYLIDEFTLKTNGTGMLAFYDVYSTFERETTEATIKEGDEVCVTMFPAKDINGNDYDFVGGSGTVLKVNADRVVVKLFDGAIIEIDGHF